MALNPIAYTEHVVRSFLRYQLTAYPFADTRLHAQMRELLSLDETRRSPLLKGPYVSLSRPFRQGAAVDTLIGEGLLHPHLRERIPESLSHLYGHQERALRAIAEGRTTLVSTGTGSGKTECFLYPHRQPVPGPAGRWRPAGHQRRHRLSDERPGRRPAHAAARAAGGHGHSVRDVRRQDAGARIGGSRGQAARGVVAGRLPGPAETGAARRQRRDGLPGRGGLLARGHAHRRAAAAHSPHQRQAARAAADAAAGRRALRRRPARFPGVRRSAYLHRRTGGRDGLPRPASSRVLRGRPGPHDVHRDLGDRRRSRRSAGGAQLRGALLRRSLGLGDDGRGGLRDRGLDRASIHPASAPGRHRRDSRPSGARRGKTARRPDQTSRTSTAHWRARNWPRAIGRRRCTRRCPATRSSSG